MWLPLAEYSMKHKVSISTLRRRIKAEDIQYRLDEGKYFIFDTGQALLAEAEGRTTTTSTETHRPSLKSETSETKDHNTDKSPEKLAQTQMGGQVAEGESVITAANRLLTDLKKAYTQVLQEKEEQIVSLKEEISDLRTLVRVLESENQRLNIKHTPQYSIPQNLDY